MSVTTEFTEPSSVSEANRNNCLLFRLLPACAATLLLASGAIVRAQTWNGVSGNWSDGINWSGGIAPVSSPTLQLTFGGTGSTSYTATNDIASTFLINSLTLDSTASVTNTIAGSSLRFAGTAPQLLLNNSGAMTIFNTTSSIADLVIGGTGSGSTTFSNTFTANNLLTFNSSATIAFTSRLEVRRALNVSGTGTFDLTNGVLHGFGLITKNGASTMIVNGSSGASQTFLGGYLIAEGQVRSSNLGSTAFRINPIQLTGAGTLAYTGSANTSLRTGELSGSGGVINTTLGTATNVGLVVHPLAPASSTATISTIGSNGLLIRGIASQTFTGDLSGLRGTVSATAYREASALYAGQARFQDATVLTFGGTAASLLATGGSIVVDNSGTNIADRIGDTTTLGLRNGGAFTYIGNTAGGTEVIGALSTGTASIGGAALLAIQPNSTTTGTVLQFANSGTFSLRLFGATTVLFTGTNLGSAGAAPRVTFIGTPFTSLGGLLSDSASATSTTIGWAVTNNERWAGYNATNGVVPLPFGNGDVARTATNLSSVAAAEVAWFAPTSSETTTTLGASISPAALRIDPSVAGQSLELGANLLVTTGLLYTGATDFTISSASTGGIANSTANRYVWVTNSSGTLKFDFNLASSNAPLNKVGDGWLEILGASNRFAFTSVINVNVLQGVLRSSLVALGGTNTAGTDGPNTTININGGTLEISGGGSLLRAINAAGTASGGGLRMQGGQVGFSAVGGDLTVTLTTAVGGTTAAGLTWGSGGFVADGFALVFGSARATSVVDLTNAINLNDTGSNTTYQPREIRVLDNTSSSNDSARLSGVLSGSSHADLLKTGAGTLELSGAANNTYTGGTLVTEGTLLIGKSAGLGATGYILLGNRASSSSASLLFNAVTPGTVLAPNVYVPADNTGTVTIGTVLFSGQYQLGGVFDVRKNVVVRTDSASIFNLDATVIGNGGFTKTGPGTFLLTGSNSFTGGVVVNDGTVRAASFGGALGVGVSGNSTVTLNSGTLDLLSTAGITFTANVVVAGNASILASRTASGTTAPTLGTLSIGSQTLMIGLGTNATSSTLNFGTASLAGDATFVVGDSMTVILNSGSSLNGISDGGAARTFTKNGNGRLALFGDNSGSITGTNTTWQLNAGVIQSSSVTRFGNSTVDLLFNGGTWNLTDNSTTPGSGRAFVFQAGGGTIDINSVGSISIVNSGQFSGSGSFTKAGLGPMTISAAQSALVGPIFINAGSLSISNASALGVPSSITPITLAGGTLGLINNSISLPVTRSVVVGPSGSGSVIDVATGLTLTLPGGFSGVGAFNKTGDGRLVMSGSSTGVYTGAANVSAGTLAVNQGLDITGGGSVTVATTGLLQGSGTITGSATDVVTINGVISPGNSVGTLTVSGASNIWNANSSVYFEFKTPGTSDSAAGTDWDYLNLTGSSLALTGPITLRIDALQSDGVSHATLTSQNPFDPVAGTYHMLFVRTAGVTGFTADTFQVQDNVANFGVFGTGNAFTPSAGQFWVSLEGNDLYLNYAAVPEPSSLLLLGVAYCGWGLHRRRRRKNVAAEVDAPAAALA